MGSSVSSVKMSEQDIEAAIKNAKEIALSDPVVVFSKTYCGYCKRVKQLLTQLGATFKVIELDEGTDGYETQSALGKWTGLKTVPNVFIGGKHIGGCDTLIEQFQKGQLLPLLQEAGAIVNTSALL